eukprot:361994-Chlamydomonas_euryale.AAC.5
MDIRGSIPYAYTLVVHTRLASGQPLEFITWNLEFILSRGITVPDTVCDPSLRSVLLSNIRDRKQQWLIATKNGSSSGPAVAQNHGPETARAIPFTVQNNPTNLNSEPSSPEPFECVQQGNSTSDVWTFKLSPHGLNGFDFARARNMPCPSGVGCPLAGYKAAPNCLNLQQSQQWSQ